MASIVTSGPHATVVRGVTRTPDQPADSVQRVMAGNQPSPPSDPVGAGSGQGWTAVSYLISGMLVWGLVGWSVDQWLGSGGVATAVGVVGGTGAGIYLIARRFGA